MTTKRPVFLTVLMVMTGVLGLYHLVGLLLVFAGVVPVRISTNWPQAAVVVLVGLIGLLFLSAAYGLWKQRRWGVWLVVLIIAYDILTQLTGSAGALFEGTFGSWTAKVTLGMLMELVLLVAVLSLLHTPQMMFTPNDELDSST